MHATITWTARTFGAMAMVAVVHVFMLWFAVPRPAAWYLGGMIYAGLIAVLFSRRSLFDKLGIYFVFVVVTVVGALTVCPCTMAHFFVAPIAGLMAIALVHVVRFLRPHRSGVVAAATEQSIAPEHAIGRRGNG